MTPIEVTRAVAADPSSVALVLAGPAARELWPTQARRYVDVVDGGRPRLTVAVDPPRRTGVGFTAGVIVRAGDGVVAGGRLTIRPDVVGAGCRLQVSLIADEVVAAAVERDAARYLDEVADVSRARSAVG